MGKKKTKTSTTETNHAVTTPNNPDWLTSGAQGLNSRIQGLAAQDPGSFVAPVSALERQAGEGASGLTTSWNGQSDGVGGDGWFGRLMSSRAPRANSASLLDNLNAYQNPYRQQVTEAAGADFDADAGRTRASQDLSLAGQGAFGGSGAALTKSLTEGELARARNSQMSRLMAEMFNTSAGLSSQDADRRQQVSIANAQMDLQDQQRSAQLGQFQAQYGLDRDANSRANIASQAALGQQLRGVDQATRMAPYSTLGQQIELFSGLPLSLFHGQSTDSTGTSNSTSTESGGALSSLLGAATGINSLWKLPGTR